MKTVQMIVLVLIAAGALSGSSIAVVIIGPPTMADLSGRWIGTRTGSTTYLLDLHADGTGVLASTSGTPEGLLVLNLTCELSRDRIECAVGGPDAPFTKLAGSATALEVILKLPATDSRRKRKLTLHSFSRLLAHASSLADEVSARPTRPLAVDAGDSQAAFELGMRYREGDGVPQDCGESLRLLRQSADADNAMALDELARGLLGGICVDPDPVEARRLARRAAMHDFYASQRLLSELLSEGVGGEQDRVEALMWLMVAFPQADIDTSDSGLTESQILLAREKAESWISENRQNDSETR